MTISSISLSKTSQNLTEIHSYGNILSRIQDLVCKISGQLQRLSEETSVKSQKLKAEYRVSAGKSADLERKIGKNSMLCASQMLISSLALGVLDPKNEAEGLKPLLGQINAALATLNPNIGLDLLHPFLQTVNSEILGSGWKWREGNLRGSQEIEKSIYNLRQTEISNEGTKSGEAKDLLQELQGLLSSIRDMYRKASS